MTHLRAGDITLYFLLFILTLICLVGVVTAGEVFTKDGAAIRGYDPVAYLLQRKPIRGSAMYTSEYRGSVFHFASAANRDRFAVNPEQYVPQYGGFCAFGMAKGYKATTDPEAFTIVDGKLYLNYSLAVRARWQQDIPGYIAKADKYWPEVKESTKVAE
jgi:YHS domain-containing protein